LLLHCDSAEVHLLVAAASHIFIYRCVICKLLPCQKDQKLQNAKHLNASAGAFHMCSNVQSSENAALQQRFTETVHRHAVFPCESHACQVLGCKAMVEATPMLHARRYHNDLCCRGMNANEACALALRAAAGQGEHQSVFLPAAVLLLGCKFSYQ